MLRCFAEVATIKEKVSNNIAHSLVRSLADEFARYATLYLG